MDHNDIRHSLSDYLDGTLPSSERTVVEEHLEKCSSCSDALSELRKTIDHLKSIEQVEPPAWMTQKIMARVREENTRKKSIWRYWYFPFRFPVETVGVVLLALTALFIYTSTQRVDRFSDRSPGKEVPAPALKQEPAKDGSTPAHRAVPQKPGYKTLDMKQEYESPPPPVPEKAPAPAAGPAAAMAPEKKGSAGTEPRDSGLPEEEQVQRRTKALGAPQKAETGISLIRLRARGTSQSSEKIEKAVKDAGGAVVSRNVTSSELIMTVRIDQAKQDALREALRRLGKAEEQKAVIDGQEGFEITVTEEP